MCSSLDGSHSRASTSTAAHGRPRDRFAAFRQPAREDLVELERPPERPAQPHVAERPAPLQADPLEPNGNELVRLIADEQVGLFSIAGDRARQRAGPRAALNVEFPEMGNRLLDDLATDAHGADELPVPMGLAVLPPRRVTEVHHLAYRAWRRQKSMK